VFTIELVNINGRYPDIQAANWRPAVVTVTRDVRRDNESRERMSATSPVHGVCSGMDKVGGFAGVRESGSGTSLMNIFQVTWARSVEVRRFGAVGVVNTLVDYVVFIALTKIMRLPLESVWIAKVMSGTLAIAVSFYLNRTWVFRTSGASLAQAARFVTVTVVGVYGIQTSLTHVFASVYPGLGEAFFAALETIGVTRLFPGILTEAFVIKTVAFALATSVSMTFNFLLYRSWVFRARAA
jgi:putative flippase GtrA